MSKSSIITSDETSADLLSPVTPGELLKEEFLVPMGISRAQMAFDLEAEKRRIEPELDKIVPVQRAVAL